MPEFRCFISIDIEIPSKIIEIEREIEKTGGNVKLVEPKNMHLTLKFLGNTNEEMIDELENMIKESIKDVEPFKIQIKGTGVFPNEKYIKIIWLGIQNGEKITQIAEKIDEKVSKLGFKKEKRSFSPHLTIGRVRNAKNKDKILKMIEKYKDLLFAEKIVDTINLKRSELTPQGPIYTTLREIKLK